MVCGDSPQIGSELGGDVSYGSRLAAVIEDHPVHAVLNSLRFRRHSRGPRTLAAATQ